MHGNFTKTQTSWPDPLPAGRTAVMWRSASTAEARHDDIVNWLSGESERTNIKSELDEDHTRAGLGIQNETLALREEIDRISMFEEIVGTSLAVQFVLTQVSKVAPTESTILILGETGTGKELVARAIHKRS